MVALGPCLSAEGGLKEERGLRGSPTGNERVTLLHLFQEGELGLNSTHCLKLWDLPDTPRAQVRRMLHELPVVVKGPCFCQHIETST